MSALRPVVWSDWVALAKQHLRDHPRVDHRGVSVAARRGSAGARATYALLTASQHAAGRALGAAPCQLCGEWTHSWCESCDPPAWAICTECDAARLVCPECEAKGETWESGHSRQCNEEGIIEVTGFTQGDGTFVRLQTPLKVPIAEVQTEQGFNEAGITRRATAAAAREAACGSSTGRA